jgi:dephospho-CoA kinase
MPKHGRIFALTGGIGSGKSTVADLFVQRGACLIDTDAIAHSISGANGLAIASIRERFGDSALAADGALDRALMRARVFTDAGARRDLEAILHPVIRDETERALGSDAACRAPYVLLAVPLLFETISYRGRYLRALAVDCAIDLQCRRVMRRSGLSISEVNQIIATQISRPLRLQLADDVVTNSGDTADLAPQVASLDAKYRAIVDVHDYR